MACQFSALNIHKSHKFHSDHQHIMVMLKDAQLQADGRKLCHLKPMFFLDDTCDYYMAAEACSILFYDDTKADGQLASEFTQ